MNLFFSEEICFVETHCCIIGANCQEKIGQIRAKAVDEGKGDPGKLSR
jgi:hypothetical protein